MKEKFHRISPPLYKCFYAKFNLIFLCENKLYQGTKAACNFIKKKALAQVFSCEFCEISKNTFFTEYLWWLLLKVCSLLITSFGEATGIDYEYLLGILLILIWFILKLETLLLRLVSSVLYWYAVVKVSFQQMYRFIVQLFRT